MYEWFRELPGKPHVFDTDFWRKISRAISQHCGRGFNSPTQNFLQTVPDAEFEEHWRRFLLMRFKE